MIPFWRIHNRRGVAQRCWQLQLGYVGSIRGESSLRKEILRWLCAYPKHPLPPHSDLRNPAATIRDLLRPQIIFLRPWILAHCIMAATKIFGNWTASLADNWTRERFEEVKDVLGELIRQLEVVQEVNDLEVQERVRPARHLCSDLQYLCEPSSADTLSRTSHPILYSFYVSSTQSSKITNRLSMSPTLLLICPTLLPMTHLPIQNHSSFSNRSSPDTK